MKANPATRVMSMTASDMPRIVSPLSSGETKGWNDRSGPVSAVGERRRRAGAVARRGTDRRHNGDGERDERDQGEGDEDDERHRRDSLVRSDVLILMLSPAARQCRSSSS